MFVQNVKHTSPWPSVKILSFILTCLQKVTFKFYLFYTSGSDLQCALHLCDAGDTFTLPAFSVSVITKYI